MFHKIKWDYINIIIHSINTRTETEYEEHNKRLKYIYYLLFMNKWNMPWIITARKLQISLKSIVRMIYF